MRQRPIASASSHHASLLAEGPIATTQNAGFNVSPQTKRYFTSRGTLVATIPRPYTGDSLSATDCSAAALTGLGTFVVGSAVTVGDSPVAIAAAQLNDDNIDGPINASDHLDLAVTSYTGNTIQRPRGSGAETFTVQCGMRWPSEFGFASLQHYPISGTSNAASLLAADIDCDGNLDLAVSSGASGNVVQVGIL